MKNYSNSKKWERQAPKRINSDGYFKVGEEVLFNATDSFYNGPLKYLHCQIEEIKVDHNKKNEYRISVYLPNNIEVFWASKSKLKKRVNNTIDKDKLKFKIGQKVFICSGNHYEATITSIEDSMNNDVLYVLQDLNKRGICKLNDRYIKSKINEVDNGKFKVGDTVAINYGHSYYQIKHNQKSLVKRVFSYDDEEEIYCDLIGHYNTTMSDRWLVKSREPIIIFSEEDPYGEEDWGEDEI